ncbi:hypothetical protein K440DRAFT_664531 [Wilcoxina mikolae CBS 423.85]|nr:hypothetical protein K440DRAFT_664531 [Wilcoxina mikolae CBS 423.85]
MLPHPHPPPAAPPESPPPAPPPSTPESPAPGPPLYPAPGPPLSPSPAPRKPFQLEICPYGDMELLLQTPSITATYLVSSHQLCCTSPVFRASLGSQSHFLEAGKLRRRGNSPTLDGSDSQPSLFQMPVDNTYDPTALATVLYVLHGRAECIPECMSFDNLLSVAIICDYYDCASAMRPWDSVWMKPLKPQAAVAGCEGWLFIAWVFGEQEVFGEMTRRFSKAGVVTGGEFEVSVGKKVVRVERHVPEGIIRDMMAQRLKAGDEITRSCRELYFRYDSDPGIKCAQKIKYCDYFVFAALHKGFSALSLNVRNEDAWDPQLQESLTLATIIHDIKILAEDISQNLNNMTVGGQRHYYCNVVTEVVKELEAHVESIEPLYLASYKRKPAVTGWDKILSGKDAAGVTVEQQRVVTEDICPDGDMEIILETDAVLATYTVSSHTLRANSLYFREYLGPESEFAEFFECVRQIAEPQTVGPKSTKTAEEPPTTQDRYKFLTNKHHDPTALAAVLRILHAQTEHLPTTVHFPALLQFAVVCEDYKCAAATQPWAKMWMEQWQSYAEKPEMEDWLFISWVFGADNIFQRLTRKFAGVGIIQSGELVIADQCEPKSTRKLGNYVPEEVTAAIIAERKKAGDKILKTCSDVYERYSDNTTTKCLNPCLTPQNFAKTCDNFLFGELHMGFKTSKLLVKDFRIPDDASIREVVSDIVRLISDTSVNTQTVRIHGIMHNGCDEGILNIARDVQAALDGIMPLSLTAFGRAPMKKCLVSWKRMLPVQIARPQNGHAKIEEDADEELGSVVSSFQNVTGEGNGFQRAIGEGNRRRRRGGSRRRGAGRGNESAQSW